MEKEFEDYWNAHRKRMLLNAPRELREEYLESTKLDSPMDWVCFVLPVAVGILVQPHIHFASEILMDYSAAHRGGAFALLQMVKPMLQKKKTTIQVIEQIKQYYYDRYKNTDWIKWSLGNRAPFFYSIYNAFIRFLYYHEVAHHVV